MEGEGWVAAGELKSDDRVRLANGDDACIASVTDTGRTAPVYNFEVDGWHTYHVGELGVWVHNANCGPAVPVLEVSRSRMPGIAANIETAIAEGAPSALNRLTGKQAIRANRRAAQRGAAEPPAGQWLDEYPFASSTQGGAGARIAPVPIPEQRLQAGLLSAFYSANKVKAGDPFLVRVVD